MVIVWLFFFFFLLVWRLLIVVGFFWLCSKDYANFLHNRCVVWLKPIISMNSNYWFDSIQRESYWAVFPYDRIELQLESFLAEKWKLFERHNLHFKLEFQFASFDIKYKLMCDHHGGWPCSSKLIAIHFIDTDCFVLKTFS